MNFNRAAQAWWDRMFKPQGPRTFYVRVYNRNGAREMERRRRQKLDFGDHYERCLERVRAREAAE